MQQPGAQRRLSSCWAYSQQVAYVVSWLNEAQMKPRCASGASAASWDSIRAAKSSPLSPNEVGGLWARVNPYRNPLPLLSAPPTQSATLTLFGGERNVRAWLFQIRRIAQPSETVIGISDWITDQRLERKKKISSTILIARSTVFLLRC